MNWRDVLPTGSLGLRTKRMRSILTALGIAIGIGAMVSVVGISSSSRADVLAQIDRLGTNLLQVAPGQTIFGQDTQLPVEAPAMIRRIRPVQSAAATRTVATTVRRNDKIDVEETGGIAVVATEPQLLSTVGGKMRAGRFLNAATEHYPAVVLGSTAASRLGIDSLAGQPLVDIGGHWFEVVGILDPVPLGPDIDRSALIGYDVAKRLFGINDSASTVRVRTDPHQVEAVRAVLAATANPQAPANVTVTRPSDALAARATTDEALTALLLALGGVALLVGGVGIANVMVIAVLERRTEIGLRRALGATRHEVRLQFLVEAVLLSALGGLAGIAIGAGITVGYASVRGWVISVPLLTLAAAVGVSFVVGAVAGLYPASRAARLVPAEAIQPA
ncbi:MAG: ABC transporter permease [Acidimicrobiia bacterium]|nr:ABC transporter permease [Acidimicrobiia bacterium]MBV8983766.1 ABC transporter permease [Acidimicrobiia bacterium]MBV9041676.1 ABC transporter permease [Acidimicrobiia bacterium]